MKHGARSALWALVLAALGCARTPDWTPPAVATSTVAYDTRNWPYEDGDSGVLAPGTISARSSAVISTLFGFGFYPALLAAAAYWTWVHRRRARAEQASDPCAPLRDGPAVVCGTVEAPPGWSGPVIRIDIHQLGSEGQNRGAWHHAWREQHRAVNVRPFTLLRDDGVRVQVEPDARVAVRDVHDDIRRQSHTQRIRVCDIQPGERVHVSGDLVGTGAGRGFAGAYRAGGSVPTLRAPALGRLVISAEAPGATSDARAGFHRKWALALAATFAFLAAVVMPEYFVLVTTGQVGSVTPTATDHWRVWHKPKNSRGYWVYHQAIQGVFVRGGVTHTVSDETGDGPANCVARGACVRVPFVVSAVAPSWHQFGFEPHLTIGRVALLVLLALTLAIAYPASTRSTRPWYLRSKVNDTGTGRLPL